MFHSIYKYKLIFNQRNLSLINVDFLPDYRIISYMMLNIDYKSLIDKHDVISFDIFDTLLLRPYLNPYDLLRHIEEYSNAPGFFDARMFAEWQARKNSKFEDITLDDIYTYIPPRFVHLKETELDFERRLLRPRRLVADIYNYAISVGKKIAIISDMYLPLEFLQDVLNRNGYSHYNWIYISGNVGLAKHTGNLYKRFLSDAGVRPESVLHIGDSKVSDIEKAKLNGLDALHIPKLADMFFADKSYQKYRDLYKLNQNSLEISMIVMHMAIKWSENNALMQSSDNYWHDFGYCVGGPIAYSLCKYMLDVARTNDIPQVLFIARDGYSLHKVFDILKSDDDSIKTYYVYAQRVLRAKCLLDYADEHNADLIIQQLQDAGVNIPKFTCFAEKENFIYLNLPVLYKNAEKSCSDYRNYLLNLGIDAELKTLVADSGAATFSAQRLLATILERDIDGVYSIITNPNYARKNKIKYNVWATNPDDIKNITSLIEFVFMAPEPPVVDIKNCAPVYQTTVHPTEQFRNKIAVDISDGILAFVRDFLTGIDGLQIYFKPIDVNNYVLAFCCGMSKLDSNMLGAVNSSSNASHTEYKQNLLRDIRSYGLVRYGEVFNIKLLTIRQTVSGKCIYFFGIPVVRTITKNYKKYIMLLHAIPVMKIVKMGAKTKYYLFGKFNIFKTCN